MKKLLLLILIVVALTGCDKKIGSPDIIEKTTNANYQIKIVFTDKDGYTVKSFKGDDGRTKYYVIPSGNVIQGYNTQSGKTQIHIPEEIETLK